MCKLVIFFYFFCTEQWLFFLQRKVRVFSTSPLLILIVLIQTQTKLLPYPNNLAITYLLFLILLIWSFLPFQLNLRVISFWKQPSYVTVRNWRSTSPQRSLTSSTLLLLRVLWWACICGFLITSCYLWI